MRQKRFSWWHFLLTVGIHGQPTLIFDVGALNLTDPVASRIPQIDDENPRFLKGDSSPSQQAGQQSANIPI
jgi:hypothetical protein